MKTACQSLAPLVQRPRAPAARGRRRPAGPSRRGRRSGARGRAAATDRARPAANVSRSGALRTTKTSAGAFRPRPSAIDRYESLGTIATSPAGTTARSSSARDPVRRPGRATEARGVELGEEIVVVEDQRHVAAGREAARDHQHVRRVADVDDVDRPVVAERADEAAHAPEGLGVLAQVAEPSRRTPRRARTGGCGRRRARSRSRCRGRGRAGRRRRRPSPAARSARATARRADRAARAGSRRRGSRDAVVVRCRSARHPPHFESRGVRPKFGVPSPYAPEPAILFTSFRGRSVIPRLRWWSMAGETWGPGGADPLRPPGMMLRATA